jgi:hypothetical protein
MYLGLSFIDPVRTTVPLRTTTAAPAPAPVRYNAPTTYSAPATSTPRVVAIDTGSGAGATFVPGQYESPQPQIVYMQAPETAAAEPAATAVASASVNGKWIAIGALALLAIVLLSRNKRR